MYVGKTLCAKRASNCSLKAGNRGAERSEIFSKKRCSHWPMSLTWHFKHKRKRPHPDFQRKSGWGLFDLLEFKFVALDAACHDCLEALEPLRQTVSNNVFQFCGHIICRFKLIFRKSLASNVNKNTVLRGYESKRANCSVFRLPGQSLLECSIFAP